MRRGQHRQSVRRSHVARSTGRPTWVVARALPARERRESGVASDLTPAAVRADPYETGRQRRSTGPVHCRRPADISRAAP